MPQDSDNCEEPEETEEPEEIGPQCAVRWREWDYATRLGRERRCERRLLTEEQADAQGEPICPLGHCARHCESNHATCGDCGDHIDSDRQSYCSDCGCCDDCCDGWRCSGCGTTYHDGDNVYSCESCETCPDCCGCRESAESHHREPGKPWRANESRNRKRNPSKRLIGFEFEFNSADDYSKLASWCREWRAGWHDDGSCGEEIVSAPLAGDHVYNCLESLGSAMKAAEAETDYRCSMHVHVDASDYSWHDVYRLIRLYAYLEPFLYLLGGQERIDNTYSRPCGAIYMGAIHDPVDPKAAVMQVALGHDATYADPRYNQTGARAYKARRPGKKSGMRYYGLNLLPWLTGRWGGKKGKFGAANLPSDRKPDCTVEFRIHQYVRVGSGRYTRPHATDAANWCALLAAILDWCANASESDMRRLPRSPLRMLGMIAPHLKGWIAKRVNTWRRQRSHLLSTSQTNNRPTYADGARCVRVNGPDGGRWESYRDHLIPRYDVRINPIDSKKKVYYQCAA